MDHRTLLPSLVFSFALLINGSAQGHAEDDDEDALVARGFEISPIPEADLKFSDKDRERVGLGSFYINAMTDCSGCHKFPQYLQKGNTAGSNPKAGSPFDGPPPAQSAKQKPLVANFNISHYLSGGQCFGPFMARNLTPEPNGMPEGLTEAEFIKVLRTGEDIHCEKEPSDPICALGPNTSVLQVMPWPTYHSMTDAQLKAIYAYLTAIPPAEPCNKVEDGCPGFSNEAATSQNYAYRDSKDCPNPAPPQ
jgi:hypothetical protein